MCFLQDIGISKDLNEKFRHRIKSSETPNEIDFSIQVLSSGSWPFNQSFNFSLPSELERSVQRFNNFYADVHSGRKLIWLYNMCKGEIVTNCFRNRYTLQVKSNGKYLLVFFLPFLPLFETKPLIFPVLSFVFRLAHFKWLYCCSLMNKLV